jgi:hypothetical protein
MMSNQGTTLTVTGGLRRTFLSVMGKAEVVRYATSERSPDPRFDVTCCIALRGDSRALPNARTSCVPGMSKA